MEEIFVFSAVMLLALLKAFPPLVIFVLEDKGGVGKSVIAQMIAAMLSFEQKYLVQMVDTDFSNSTSAQIFTGARMLNLNEKASLGAFSNLLRALKEKMFHHLVFDVGAREEKTVRLLLKTIVGLVRALGGEVVVFRPISLGSHNQTNACNFMDVAEPLGISTVFVVNEGQGRLVEYFDRWKSSVARSTALNRGAVETHIHDAGILYLDEAIGFGLSLTEIALRDFTKLSDEDRVAAEGVFTEDVCAWVNMWMCRSMMALAEATRDAIAKRRQLDGAAGQKAGGEADEALPANIIPAEALAATKRARKVAP